MACTHQSSVPKTCGIIRNRPAEYTCEWSSSPKPPLRESPASAHEFTLLRPDLRARTAPVHQQTDHNGNGAAADHFYLKTQFAADVFCRHQRKRHGKGGHSEPEQAHHPHACFSARNKYRLLTMLPVRAV